MTVCFSTIDGSLVGVVEPERWHGGRGVRGVALGEAHQARQEPSAALESLYAPTKDGG